MDHFTNIILDRTNKPGLSFFGRLLFELIHNPSDDTAKDEAQLTIRVWEVKDGGVVLELVSRNAKLPQNNFNRAIAAKEIALLKHILSLEPMFAKNHDFKLQINKALNRLELDSVEIDDNTQVLTVDEFVELVNQSGWLHEKSYKLTGKYLNVAELPVYIGTDKHGNSFNRYIYEHEDTLGIDVQTGNGLVVSLKDGFKITHEVMFNYDLIPHSSIDVLSETIGNFGYSGFVVVNDSDEIIHGHDLMHLIYDSVGADFKADYYVESLDILDTANDTSELSNDEIPGMSNFFLENKMGRNTEFTGKLIATIDTINQENNYDGYRYGTWFKLSVYNTASGKFVVHRIARQVERNHDINISEVKIVQTYDEVIEFFGQSYAAKQLYDAAGIENIQWLNLSDNDDVHADDLPF